MKNKIIAVDFDGTLCERAYPDIGAPKEDVIAKLKKEQQQGAKIILWTCRGGEKLAEAIYWCERRGLVFDAINENLSDIIKTFGRDCRKIFANEYWDDAAFNPLQDKENKRRLAEVKNVLEEVARCIDEKYIY